MGETHGFAGFEPRLEARGKARPAIGDALLSFGNAVMLDRQFAERALVIQLIFIVKIRPKPRRIDHFISRKSVDIVSL